MSNFYERERMSEADARAALMEPSNRILHLLQNDDGTFSIMSHIVCEWCDYCESGQGDCRGRNNVEPRPAQANPYEKLQRDNPEWHTIC